ncbi:centrosomal protein CEP57L1 [Gadus chalcogrammus]|uniref:centrosomal protein CEP57L1 n=1 Tax=Gadus chalcogrammus TaxID=1042646 RepID=UPI0024C4B966|nr:centrosomal protein CEP57L1 [Gadus chalcogrammus]XP_056437070.1 centrosomal protein CEP57L1 [Gadus chalcogrammus]
MDTSYDRSSDSPSKNSYIGSYYQPPDRILPRPEPPLSMNTPGLSPGLSRTTDAVSSKAVIDALKTLQEKIRRLELERKRAEKNIQPSSLAACSVEPNATSSKGPTRIPHTAAPKNINKTELVSQLQAAEARCRGLEKQLDYMRWMMEKAQQDKNTLAEKQASLQRQTVTDCTSLQNQQEKLEKLEKECIKLSQTQSQASRKMFFLEQRLVAEEHERRLVQEKADELQREMDINLRLSSPPSQELKPKKKSGRASASKPSSEPMSQSLPTARRLPFVAGTSTSPSHSVSGNMQSLLHMLKHHQPQLCNHMRSLHQARGGARRSLRRALTGASPTPETSGPGRAAQDLDSLSDLLLALQDELGQMSFEHQELVRQIEKVPGRETSEELEPELESLLKKMEDKGVQITKLRQHQQTVRLLTQNKGRAAGGGSRGSKASGASSPPQPSPVRERRPGRRGGASQSGLHILKETQRFRNSLKTDDISWET